MESEGREFPGGPEGGVPRVGASLVPAAQAGATAIATKAAANKRVNAGADVIIDAFIEGPRTPRQRTARRPRRSRGLRRRLPTHRRCWGAAPEFAMVCQASDLLALAR